MPALICPECQTPLQDLSTETFKLNHCSTCQGMWLSQQAFVEKCRHAENQAAPSGPGRNHPMVYNPASDPIRYRPCPQCQQRMNRMNFAKRSGVVIDVCRSHGVWLDHTELERIIHFIHTGGLQNIQPKTIRKPIPLRDHIAHKAIGLDPVLPRTAEPSHLWDIPAEMVVEAIGELLLSAFDGF